MSFPQFWAGSLTENENSPSIDMEELIAEFIAECNLVRGESLNTNLMVSDSQGKEFVGGKFQTLSSQLLEEFKKLEAKRDFLEACYIAERDRHLETKHELGNTAIYLRERESLLLAERTSCLGEITSLNARLNIMKRKFEILTRVDSHLSTNRHREWIRRQLSKRGATEEEAVTANKRAEEWQAKYEAAAHESSSKDFKLDQQRFFFEQNIATLKQIQHEQASEIKRMKAKIVSQEIEIDALKSET